MRQSRIDYRMRRRAVLREVVDGLKGPDDVCDAHPDLVRAGIHIGSPSREPCPICEGEALTRVSYAFESKGRRTPGGRAVPREALARHAERYGDCTIYTVEVCPDCRWHHLVESFLLVARAAG